MCPIIRATSYYARKCCSFDYHIKYFQISITSQSKKYTLIKYCITYRFPVCNLSDEVTKPKKSYGNQMKANVEENIILRCPEIRATSHYARKCHSFVYHIKYYQSRIMNQAKKYTQIKHCRTYRVPACNLSDDMTNQKVIW